MTFLRRYSFGAVALNMAASAVVYLEAILVVGAMQQMAFGQNSTGSNRIVIGIPLLIDSAFCAASSMIAYGAVIGKTTPAQLILLVVAQVPLYAANQHLTIHVFKALDMGGTLVIHLFGAYYGLAASFMLSRRQGVHGVDHPKVGERAPQATACSRGKAEPGSTKYQLYCLCRGLCSKRQQT